MTASNPGILASGIVGESKADLLCHLPDEVVIPWGRIQAKSTDDACEQFVAMKAERAWSFPLILKPNASQRGVGLKLALTETDVRAYFERDYGDIMIQANHLGPYEAGIFYFRHPSEDHGAIFSITDKQFPELVGNGKSTIRELIYQHPRYRMQAKTFLTRHLDNEEQVLKKGECFRLGVAGNHCQGTHFLDGARLITPELAAQIDSVAKAFDGFFIGRFDVRYSDPEAFMAGKDLHIVELNGAMSESTNLYDQDTFSLFQAYGILFRQWQILFQIGFANRQAGYAVTSLRDVIRIARHHYKTRKSELISD